MNQHLGLEQSINIAGAPLVDIEVDHILFKTQFVLEHGAGRGRRIVWRLRNENDAVNIGRRKRKFF